MTASWRTIRVFISSTFCDMQAERDQLVRYVFPRLREELLKRRVHLLDIDLRWGLTSEEDTLQACRQIIDQCRPWFICILGGRYGSVPPGASRSITADEVYHAALDTPDPAAHHFFYFRDPAVTQSIPEAVARAGGYRELASAEEVEKYGRREAERRARERDEKLAELKQQIKDAGLPVFTYPCFWNEQQSRLDGLEQFGEKVYRDLLESIDREYPDRAGDEEDWFAEENAAMEAFVESRVETFVEGSRRALLEEMVRFAQARGEPNLLCVTGPPGTGKSALLARFSQEYLASHSGTVLIAHFVGASPGSTSLRRTLRRLCRALSLALGTEETIPEDLGELRQMFPRLLQHAARCGNVVLLVDALDQFDPTPSGQPLSWLPRALPESVRVITSCSEHSVLQGLHRRGESIKQLVCGPLQRRHARAIVERFLQLYQKRLDHNQLDMLLAKREAASPLYLLIALEQLRTLGTFEKLTTWIRRMPDSVTRLFDWILQRLEEGVEGQEAFGRELVSAYASYVAIGRGGMSERDLEQLCRPVDRQNRFWLLHRMLRPYLMHRGELVDFSHSQLRRVVEERYLDDGVCRQRHREVAKHFQQRGYGYRRTLGNLPYHLYEAGAFDELTDVLCDREFLDRGCAEVSCETMLENLQFGFLAARNNNSVEHAVRVLSAWGYVVEAADSQAESRAVHLVREGRVADAITTACGVRSPARAGGILVKAAHCALDIQQPADADRILQVLLRGEYAVPRGSLADYLRLVDRNVALGNEDALECLYAKQPEEMALRVLGYLVGTRCLREETLGRLLQLLERLPDLAWRGVCLLVLCCRALRYGLSRRAEVATRLKNVLTHVSETGGRAWLVEAVSRAYRWIAHLGITPEDLGVTTALRAQRAARTAPPAIRQSWDDGKVYGQFRFLSPRDVADEPAATGTHRHVLQWAIAALLNSLPASTMVSQRAAGSTLQSCIGQLLATGRNDPCTLAFRELLAGEPGRSDGTIGRLLDSLDELSHEERVALLLCLIKRGDRASVANAIREWEARSADSARLADVYRTVAELDTWSEAADYLMACSDRLKKALQIESPMIAVELARALLRHGRREEAGRWMAFLIGHLAPPMTLPQPMRRAPATARAYVLLSEALLSEECNEQVQRTQRWAAATAQRIVSDCPALAETLREEFGSPNPPVTYAADRILAFAVEDAAWLERKGEKAAARFSQTMRLGIVDDDRERIRAWFCWLLVLSADPTPAQIRLWREGVCAARAAMLPHEQLLAQAMGIDLPKEADQHSIARALAVLVGAIREPAGAELLGRFTDAALRGFSTPAAQAEAIGYVAEALARAGKSTTAAVMALTADALVPGYKAFAEKRIELAELAASGDPAALAGLLGTTGFDDAFHEVVQARQSRKDRAALLNLTEFLGSIPRGWRALLLALCALPLSPAESLDAVRMLMGDLAQYGPRSPERRNTHAEE